MQVMAFTVEGGACKVVMTMATPSVSAMQTRPRLRIALAASSRADMPAMLLYFSCSFPVSAIAPSSRMAGKQAFCYDPGLPNFPPEFAMTRPSAFYPPTKRIGILVFDDFEPLDVWGFCEAFSIARFLGTGYGETQHLPFELVLISNQEGQSGQMGGPRPVKSYNGPKVAPDLFRNQALEQHFDVLMVPGGAGVNQLFASPARLQSVLAWLVAMDARVGLMSSVCSGAALLACAGLLDGHAAATNHQAFGWVVQQGPRVLWDNVARWVDAGRYVTSAGVSAGTDMAFYLVQRLAGRAVAEQAALAAEYGWQRDPGSPVFYPQQAAMVPAK